MRHPDEIIHNGKTLTEILRLHKCWLSSPTEGERACLDGASLDGASLDGASLNHASLNRASLDGASLNGASLNQQCPEEGSFIAFKKARNGIILKLDIPAEAKRSSATTRKCRASCAKVLEISGGLIEAISKNYSDFIYRVGEMVYPDSFDENRWDECSHGIHFFITRAEAEAY